MIDLFTKEEIEAAKKILREHKFAAHNEILKIVDEKVMERIDKQTGQKNVRSYMAYRLEYFASLAQVLR